VRMWLAGLILGAAWPALAGVEPKSVADGLILDGSASYLDSGSTVTLTVTRIRNDSTTRVTGPLRLELWAVSGAKPARGALFTGNRLAASDSLGAIPPISLLSAVVKVAAFTPPADGTYWMVLVLAESGLPGCVAPDGYCLSDSFVFSAQRTFNASAVNYSDLWWNAAEPGTGVSIIHHASGVAFITWFTYNEAGKPQWFVSPDCTVVGTGCTGTLFEASGPSAAAAFDPARVSRRTVGSVSFVFADANQGTMSWRIGARSGSVSLTRQPF
jgi:hypothetical protein